MRNLEISKYRETKGDEQLDLNYQLSGHHVTEILSELTYYHYLSRVTPVPILQKYVRGNYRPSEFLIKFFVNRQISKINQKNI